MTAVVTAGGAATKTTNFYTTTTTNASANNNNNASTITTPSHSSATASDIDATKLFDSISALPDHVKKDALSFMKETLPCIYKFYYYYYYYYYHYNSLHELHFIVGKLTMIFDLFHYAHHENMIKRLKFSLQFSLIMHNLNLFNHLAFIWFFIWHGTQQQQTNHHQSQFRSCPLIRRRETGLVSRRRDQTCHFLRNKSYKTTNEIVKGKNGTKMNHVRFIGRERLKF